MIIELIRKIDNRGNRSTDHAAQNLSAMMRFTLNERQTVPFARVGRRARPLRECQGILNHSSA
jgi:hypothetical protein